MKQTNLSSNDTSYFGISLDSSISVETLTVICGCKPYDNCNPPKVDCEWILESDEGFVFTIYDWHSKRWNIGAMTKEQSIKARDEVLLYYNKLKNKGVIK